MDGIDGPENWSRWGDAPCTVFSGDKRRRCESFQRRNLPLRATDAGERRRRKPPPVMTMKRPPDVASEAGSPAGFFRQDKADCPTATGVLANGGAMNLGICEGWFGSQRAIVKYVRPGGADAPAHHIDGDRETAMLARVFRVCRDRRNGGGCRHVVTLLDIIRRPSDGATGIVMNFLNGGTLKSRRVDILGRPGRIWTVTEDVLRGLQFLHDHGIVHCDIKADNVMLHRAAAAGREGEEEYAVITDLGFATRVGHPIVFGFPGFMLYGTGEPARPDQDRYALVATVYSLFDPGVVNRLFDGSPATRPVIDAQMRREHPSIAEGEAILARKAPKFRLSLSGYHPDHRSS
jgi:serine/threonine protein kinase